MINIDRLQANVSTLKGGAESPEEVVQQLFLQRIDWFELIKTLRMIYKEGSILEIEKLALSHEGWRRWCNHRIATDPKCRKIAWAHLKQNGINSLVQKTGTEFQII